MGRIIKTHVIVAIVTASGAELLSTTAGLLG